MNFECGMDNMKEFSDELVLRGAVQGFQIHTRSASKPRHRVITGRSATTLHHHVVVAIEQLTQILIQPRDPRDRGAPRSSTKRTRD
jgi:hypothetical protein